METKDARYRRGLALWQRVMGEVGDELLQQIDELSPDLKRLTIEFPYGDVNSRPGLDLRTRELINVAALTAMGALPQLQLHVRGALNSGCSRLEITEVILQMAVYAGFPAALNGMIAAGEVLEREPMPSRVCLEPGAATG
jgi:4-carboxymuconolactone decarboxylase